MGRYNCEWVTKETLSLWSLGRLECRTKSKQCLSKDKQEVLLYALLILSQLRNLSSFITVVWEKLGPINWLEELLKEQEILICKRMVYKMYVEHNTVDLFCCYKRLIELSNSTERWHSLHDYCLILKRGNLHLQFDYSSTHYISLCGMLWMGWSLLSLGVDSVHPSLMQVCVTKMPAGPSWAHRAMMELKDSNMCYTRFHFVSKIQSYIMFFSFPDNSMKK